ncbi:hypothetical protein BP00DRAFT_49976 [Aspergillus indologenus CBS 114.80]|uniref:Uncharacterized protein n=1 Tax=Aspergillus indologenus CBS 114.80 TaxID=1450541 RepID=A0A2V5HYJ3_9EURO|nr:hypothetical protein BP00DRAFT_49976 [Aspergillus indologenus CBS 114.80]
MMIGIHTAERGAKATATQSAVGRTSSSLPPYCQSGVSRFQMAVSRLSRNGGIRCFFSAGIVCFLPPSLSPSLFCLVKSSSQDIKRRRRSRERLENRGRKGRGRSLQCFYLESRPLAHCCSEIILHSGRNGWVAAPMLPFPISVRSARDSLDCNQTHCLSPTQDILWLSLDPPVSNQG